LYGVSKKKVLKAINQILKRPEECEAIWRQSRHTGLPLRSIGFALEDTALNLEPDKMNQEAGNEMRFKRPAQIGIMTMD
jgi:hypothetical protein